MFLEIRNIKKSFGQGDSFVEVLKGINLEINRGEFCVLLGPSGSGKSTLLNIIGGIDGADSGDIYIDGEKMSNMNEKRLTLYRRKHLGYIFQMYNLIPNLTVQENIEVGAYLSDKPLEMEELLRTLGLYEHRKKLPNQLSGGQQQRLCIARTLLKHPKVLIFDDSTSAVDTATEGKIRHALAALTDVTKLIIAQRITSVMDADMIVILDDGKVHAVGTHKELLANDTIYQEIYASQMKGDDADGKGIQR